MEQISIYFKKFEGLGIREASFKKSLTEAVLSVLGGDVDYDAIYSKIKIEREKIRIGVIGPLKNEILLNRKKIQEKFEFILGTKNQTNQKEII
jgi:hypothetical protein